MALALVLAAVLAIAFSIRAIWPRDAHASPKDAVRAFVAAAKRRDFDSMRAVTAAPDRFRRAVAFERNVRKVSLLDAVARAHEPMEQRPAIKVRLLSISEVSRRALEVGDEYDHGRALEPFEACRHRVTLCIDDSMRDDECDAIRLDGRWLLLIPSP